MFDALLKRKDVEDIITTTHTVFILHTPTHALPVILSDKEIVLVPAPTAYTHPRISEMLTGHSMRCGKQLAGNAHALIEYDVRAHTASTKQRLAHALSGTKTRTSLLEQTNGRRIGRGALLVPAHNAQEITQYLDELEITYANTTVFLGGEQ